jgi:hypothetical protein
MRMLKVGRRTKGLLDTATVQAVVNEVQDAYGMWGGDGALAEASSSTSSMVKVRFCFMNRNSTQVFFKGPSSLRPHTSLGLSAVNLPHGGTSYNPTLEDHQELLLKAHEAEAKRVAEQEKWNGVKEQMMKARQSQTDEYDEGVAPGMKVDQPVEQSDAEGGSDEGENGLVKKSSKPKTKKQRRKAAVLLAEVRGPTSLPALLTNKCHRNESVLLRQHEGNSWNQSRLKLSNRSKRPHKPTLSPTESPICPSNRRSGISRRRNKSLGSTPCLLRDWTSSSEKS